MAEAATTIAVKGVLAAGKTLTSNKRWLAKLLNQPDTAAVHLSAALTEFRRSVEAIREVLLRMRYLSAQDPGSVELRDSLTRVRDGQLLPELKVAIGRCATIRRIHETYLRGWIDDVIGSKKASEFTYLFNELGSSDARVIKALEDLSGEAKHVATLALERIDEGRSPDAGTLLKQHVESHKEHISDINKLLAYMLEQENRFFERANII